MRQGAQRGPAVAEDLGVEASSFHIQ
jgi:hypothetical protein